MTKTILITGATDGIGLETARMLVQDDHRVLIHGRNSSKLQAVHDTLSALPGSGTVESYLADLSSLSEVDAMADKIRQNHDAIDVLINNAGILNSKEAITSDGLDIRFVVNTFAPYRLTQQLERLLSPTSRVLNLSSAAQAPVNPDAMLGKVKLDAMEAYAQSKLAITMWSSAFASTPGSPIVIAVNPGSLLGSKMVKEGFGIDGGDLSVGANILCRVALSEEFESASGQYFDNDAGRLAPPHADALDPAKVDAVMKTMERIIDKLV